MPYTSWKDVNPAIKEINPQPTLSQANVIAGWADSIKERRGDVNPWAVAIALFKRKYHVEGTGDKRKWVKNKDTKKENGLADQVLDLIEGLEALEVLPIVDHFPWWKAAPIFSDDGIAIGEPGYVVDLFAELPQTAEGRPDFSQPFRILPAGTLHRFGQERTVTADDIDLFADNWRHRAERGIRRSRVVVDLEHEPGGIGEYADIFSRGGDGLWAQISITPKGWEILDQRGDFWFFSPTVAWESQDRVTGKVVRNQIVGGALTNYPVFGDATAIPTMGYSEPALHRLWSMGIEIAGYATKAGGDGKDYPASAFLIVEDKDHPTTWHLRVKEYVNGKLQYTRNMCSKAAQALSPKGFRGQPVKLSAEQRKKAKAGLLSIYRNTLKMPDEEIPKHLFSTKGGHSMTVEFTQEDRTVLNTLANLFGPLFSRKGGEPMPEGNGEDGNTITITIDQEAFSTLQQQVDNLTQQVETLSQERDGLKQQVQASQTQLAAEVQARQLQEMRQHVQQFSHLALPLEIPEGQEGDPAQVHFAWLFNADPTDGKKHWAFFNAALQSANAALEEASAFTELGSGEQPLSEDEQLHQQALAYAQQHQVDYTTALLAVARGEPVNAK